MLAVFSASTSPEDFPHAGHGELRRDSAQGALPHPSSRQAGTTTRAMLALWSVYASTSIRATGTASSSRIQPRRHATNLPRCSVGGLAARPQEHLWPAPVA
jgi:hypothetical protein